MAVGTCANGCPTLPSGVGPTQFNWTQGNPLVTSNMFDMGAFVQDDWRVAQGLTLSAGLRWEGQTNIHDWHDVAPRALVCVGARPPRGQGHALDCDPRRLRHVLHPLCQYLTTSTRSNITA